MSRIGKQPIAIPAGVTVTLDGGNGVTVKGPKGTLNQIMHPKMKIVQEGAVITVTRPDDEKESKSLHGLTRTLINNMVVGVTQGFSKELEINGVGYRAQKAGKTTTLNLGFSHNITVDDGDGIVIEVPTPNKLVVTGPDKQRVGQVAAEIRGKRPPEPYLGKGIKYTTERIRRKAGKAGKK